VQILKKSKDYFVQRKTWRLSKFWKHFEA